MPRYRYRCPECGHTKDTAHSIHDDPVIYCPLTECDGIMERDIFAPAGVKVRGGTPKFH